MTTETRTREITVVARTLPKADGVFLSAVKAGYYGASTTMATAASDPFVAVTVGAALREAYSQPSLVSVRRRAAAQQFAGIVSNLRGVEQVWLDSTQPFLRMIVIIRQLDLERELELRGVYISLTNASEPDAELSVFARDDEVPDWAADGERLA